MARITVIGGTGYAGAAIVAEAARRGHEVTAISRSIPEEPIPGVTYVQGSALDEQVQADAFTGADAVVSATSPRGDMLGEVLKLNTALAARAAETGVTLGVVGGFSSLRPAKGEPAFYEAGIPEAYRDEALEGVAVLDALKASDQAADWFYLSPAATFTASNPGPALGVYRLSDDVALFDSEGKSAISAPDYALAFVDALESDQHRRAHISAAY